MRFNYKGFVIFRTSGLNAYISIIHANFIYYQLKKTFFLINYITLILIFLLFISKKIYNILSINLFNISVILNHLLISSKWFVPKYF